LLNSTYLFVSTFLIFVEVASFHSLLVIEMMKCKVSRRRKLRTFTVEENSDILLGRKRMSTFKCFSFCLKLTYQTAIFSERFYNAGPLINISLFKPLSMGCRYRQKYKQCKRFRISRNDQLVLCKSAQIISERRSLNAVGQILYGGM